MVTQCSICLSSKFKEPVCTPCGHVYCQQCLIDHANVPSNQGMTSTCPECRTEFSLVVPELRYLPPKYHPFIQPAIRRIYADMSPDAGLRQKVKQLEKSLLVKTKTEDMLMKKCEGLAAALDVHRRGERDAVAEAQELEEKIAELEYERDEAVTSLNEKYYDLEEENQALKRDNGNWATKFEALHQRLKESEARQRSLERALAVQKSKQRNTELLHELTVAAHEVAMIGPQAPVFERPMKPMPRRRLLRTRDEDTSISAVASAKRPRISDVQSSSV
ncbi:hypothetical protein CVT26_007354 [Gymnopilus dilepis]|uniref:RING-type domain-containing protein n=1 Tax=Gymnopilus dilepis TaxID=231916 RepID=A0A409VP78_9AGAR|nr:hypothetical protein CVT26_007354 [Gymnopilus dilepis]